MAKHNSTLDLFHFFFSNYIASNLKRWVCHDFCVFFFLELRHEVLEKAYFFGVQEYTD